MYSNIMYIYLGYAPKKIRMTYGMK